MTNVPNKLTIVEASRALRARELSVSDLFDACTTIAKEKNEELNAYLELFERDESAIAIAQKRIDEEGEDAPVLCGIPLAMKDNILIEGNIASAASKILSNYRATYDATVTKKLKSAGALFLGRTNMDEFALGGSTENSAYGATRNPHDTTRVAGGTSGGSAAAVAADMAICALGTDTGGSVRNPASFCGLVGLKPTYGAVSRYGLIAAVSSFDQAGPLTKTVEDARILFNTISGKDLLDSTSHDNTSVTKEVKRIGILPELIKNIALIDGGVIARNFEETIAELSSKGYEVVEVDIPSIPPSLAAYYIINFAEVSTNLARFDTMRYGVSKEYSTLLEDYVQNRSEGFGTETKRRILLGTFVLSSGYIDAYYNKANAVRNQLRLEYERAFSTVDVIATPTMPTGAFTVGARLDPMSLYLEDVFTVMANLTGTPAISVPMKEGIFYEDKTKSLPTGIQFTAPHGGEERLFTIGKTVTGE